MYCIRNRYVIYLGCVIKFGYTDTYVTMMDIRNKKTASTAELSRHKIKDTQNIWCRWLSVHVGQIIRSHSFDGRPELVTSTSDIIFHTVGLAILYIYWLPGLLAMILMTGVSSNLNATGLKSNTYK